MTYEESYRRCTSLAELLKAIKHDTFWASLINPDRLKVIQEAVSIIVKEKGWTIE
jgi:hypothetical protein